MIEPDSSATASPAGGPFSPGTNRKPEVASPSIRPATCRPSARFKVSFPAWPWVRAESRKTAARNGTAKRRASRGIVPAMVARRFMDLILRGASRPGKAAHDPERPPDRIVSDERI